MKRLVFAVAAILLLGSASAENYTMDPHHTYASFTINHLGFSTMHGKFQGSKGTLSIDPVSREAEVEVTIDAASIWTGYDKRDDHLKSADFFNSG